MVNFEQPWFEVLINENVDSKYFETYGLCLNLTISTVFIAFKQSGITRKNSFGDYLIDLLS